MITGEELKLMRETARERRGTDLPRCLDEIERLTAELTTLQQDKARLDWLDRDGRIARGCDGWNSWTHLSKNPIYLSDGVRQAIDKVMEAK